MALIERSLYMPLLRFFGASKIRYFSLYVSSHIGFFSEVNMQTRVAVMSIIVEDPQSVERLNAVLHEYGNHIIGRMGIPYRQKNISIVSVALDAPQDTISALAGKLGAISGLSVKTAYSNVKSDE